MSSIPQSRQTTVVAFLYEDTMLLRPSYWGTPTVPYPRAPVRRLFAAFLFFLFFIVTFTRQLNL